jgi:hypothetical protein
MSLLSRAHSRRFSVLAAGIALLLLSVTPAAAQEASPGPLASIAKRLGTQKATASKASAASTKFTPSGKRLTVAKMADALADTADEKKALIELFENALKSFEEETKRAGMANDVAPALAFFVQTHWSVYAGKEAPEAGADKMIGQIRAVLDMPEMAAMSDADKQSFSEYCVCMSALTLTMYQAAEGNKDGMATLRATAGKSLQTMLGAEPSKIAITAKGLEISGATADTVVTANAAAKAATGAKVTYTAPPNTREEQMGGTTILWRPKYDGYTKNINGTESLYYAVLPTLSAAAKPDREAAFEETWKSFSEVIKVNWPNRTILHRFYLPNGAVCYVAQASFRANETFGGYGDCDGGRMTLCLLDFGNCYVPVAQVFFWTKGSDNLHYIQAPFDAFVASVRVANATVPKPYATKQELVGDWTVTDGSYSSTDYYYAGTGNYAGNVTNVSSSRHTLKLRADGTCRHEFSWYLNGRFTNDIWDGTWTFDRGKIILKNPKTGKTDEYTLMFSGKQVKTGERFLAVHRVYSSGSPLTPQNSHSTDTKIFTPLKKKD